MSKITSILLASAALLALGQTPAKAVEYPYCMYAVEGWAGMIERCDFSTMEQCRATASGLNGSCQANWRLEYWRQHPQTQGSVQPPDRRPRR